MIWKLVKFYKTPFEKTIKEFDSYKEALKLLETLFTEAYIPLEIYFEDPVWNPQTNKFEIEKFTVRTK
jgi:hypothetical protein